MNEESIFAVALEKQTAAERQDYLDEACGRDAELRAQVEELLRASDEAGSFLGHAAVGTDATVAATVHSGDTARSGSWPASLPFLEPCDKPDRLGQLGHYEIMEVVGHGGMGTVLRAFDRKLSRVVAVKVMAPELAANPTAVKRFLREAQTAAAVHHDHVVTIHNVEEQHRPPYLVMQFIEGQTLQQKIDREGAQELTHILRIGSQMAAGLAAAHKQGLIHRDVKPGNILLENGVERVKITDFGLARAADDVEITQAGMIAGTPQYMSPEQARGEPVDSRSDLFSLGCVLYTMCTGRNPFRAETTMGVLHRVCNDAPRPIHEVNPQIPSWLEAIVGKLLAKNPEGRFQSAAEVADLLGQHLAHLQNPQKVPLPQTAMLQPQAKGLIDKRRLDWKLTALGMLVAAIVLSLPLVLAGMIIAGWFYHGVQGRTARGVVVAPTIPRTTDSRTESPTAESVNLVEWGKFFDPVGNCQIKRRTHQVEFLVPGTIPYNLLPTAPGGSNAPRLLRDAEGDFVLQVRILPFTKALPGTSTAGSQSSSWRSAGLFLIGGEQTLLRLERVSWGEKKAGAPMAHCEWFAAGQRKGDYYGGLSDDERWTMLQVERRGDVLHLRYSDDGSRWEDWQTIADLPLPKRVVVGLVAVHTTPTAFDPCFEDLRFSESPSSGAAVAAAPVARITPAWALEFDGVDDVVTAPHVPFDKFPDWTVEAWVKDWQHPLLSQGRAVDPENSLWLSTGESTTPESVWPFPLRCCGWEFGKGENAQYYVGYPPPGVWTHLAMVYAGSRQCFFRDGKLLYSQSVRAPGPLVPERSLLIGGHQFVPRTYYGSGLLGPVRISSVARWTGDFAPPTAYVPDERTEILFAMSDRDPQRLVDASGHNRHGEITGAAWVEDAAASGKRALATSFGREQARSLQETCAQELGVPVEIENSLGMKLRLIPPGEFQIGTDAAALERLVERLGSEEQLEFVDKLAQEQPPRRARVREPFYLGTCEVTVAQFRRFAAAQGYVTDGERSGDGGWSGRDGDWIRHKTHLWKTPGAWPLADDQPVVHISQRDAQAFCDWLSREERRSYALPTEVQWEYAARAGSGGLFGASDDPDSLADIAWYKHSLPAERRNQPQPVGGRPANAFGLFDMLGNVWEWTSTWHPTFSDQRVMRGGSWYNQALLVRPAARVAANPLIALDAGTGFRVAIVGDLRPPAAEAPND